MDLRDDLRLGQVQQVRVALDGLAVIAEPFAAKLLLGEPYPMSSLQHNELVRSKSGAPPQCGIRARLCPEWANSVFGDVDSMSGLPAQAGLNASSHHVAQVPILLQKSPKREARCALAPTATHSVRAVALRGLR